ncbi:serine hydrolase domain-containing protein [Wenzhouxiangella marina]|nr:serine hydrolase domain-containing protein [Wenzhouxiangella marina]MBB6086691.1 D-alanyl-D-alanine carboxypeptidase [Wenzhouxiangella marina]
MGSVVILEDGETIFDASVGYANLSQSVPNDQHTLYRIASISKPYTAAMVFRAIEQERLALDASLSDFFPTIPEAEGISIEHLLQHRSGIANYTGDASFRDYHVEGIAREDLLRLIERLPREFAPGEDARYSNSNYFLLALILEALYEQSYAELIQSLIAEPLGLTNTFHPTEVGSSAQEALSYEREEDWITMPTTHPSSSFGAGSIVATTSELARFMNALMEGSIVSAESLSLMQSTRGGHGMGLQQLSVGSRTAYGHGGMVDGFESLALFLPEEKLVIAITANATTEGLNGLVSRIEEAYFGDEEHPLAEGEASTYAGIYAATDGSSDTFAFIERDGSLILLVMNEFEEPLTYRGDGRFVFEQMYAAPMVFSFSEDGQSVTMTQGDFEGSYRREASAN